jgi:hypothetical protein
VFTLYVDWSDSVTSSLKQVMFAKMIIIFIGGVCSRICFALKISCAYRR